MGTSRESLTNALLRGPYGICAIILMALLAVFAYTAVITHTLNESILQNAVEQNTERTDAMYQGVTSLLSDDAFEDINTSADKSSKLYQSMQTTLNQTRNMNNTRYFYTAKRAADGTLVYLVDGLDKDASDFRNPGDPIEAEMIPYIERALGGEVVYSQDIVDTTWGHIFTACYPVRANGNSGVVLGVLCIETDMESTYSFLAEHQKVLVRIAVVAALISVALVLCVSLFVRRTSLRERQDRKKLIESGHKLEEALSSQSEHASIVSALANIYTTIFSLDLKTYGYEVIESVALMHGVAGKSGTITQERIEDILDAFICQDMRDEMRAFLDLSTMPERLRDKNTVMVEYVDPTGRWFQGRLIVKKRDERGEATQVIYAARDFTDEKERELDLRNQLRDAAMEARRASQSKTSFLRRMSHDIRTPLNGIIGMLRLSDKYADDPARLKDAREKILHSADYLLDLVNNVLDISKLESGALELEYKPFNLGEVLLRSLPGVETSATEHGIKFEGGRETSKLVHLELIGSPLHLNRVLMNLASNAIKYNRSGGTVTLTATEIASDENTATYEFVCADTGLGMSEEFQKRAFEPFAQEGKETTTSFSGSGLGLSIVKDIVEMMNGTIRLESQEGVGTTFTVVIPFEINHDAATTCVEACLPKHIDLSGRRALLVEDNELNLEIAYLMLQEEGLIVSEARNGQEAVAAFQSSQTGYFDYIFMDVMMPVMDGLEATRAIRALGRHDAATVKIVAMTANAFAEDRKACLEAGMDAHVSKPIDMKNLKDTLAAL